MATSSFFTSVTELKCITTQFAEFDFYTFVVIRVFLYSSSFIFEAPQTIYDRFIHRFMSFFSDFFSAFLSLYDYFFFFLSQVINTFIFMRFFSCFFFCFIFRFTCPYLLLVCLAWTWIHPVIFEHSIIASTFDVAIFCANVDSSIFFFRSAFAIVLIHSVLCACDCVRVTKNACKVALSDNDWFESSKKKFVLFQRFYCWLFVAVFTS